MPRRAAEKNVEEAIARMHTLYLDADACPVTREALACARRARVPVVIVGNATQNLERHVRRDDPRDAAHARGRDAAHAGFWVEALGVSVGKVPAHTAMEVQIRKSGNHVRHAMEQV